MVPEPRLVDRFANDLNALIDKDERVGIAVSGGPDSMALLLLASAARPGKIEAASVDHALRPESAAEAELVATTCERLGVPHTTLRIVWDVPPDSAIQEQARKMRYGALGRWADERALNAIVTAHHADDQAETLLMRLNRGSGVHGLAGMRPVSIVPDGEVLLLRPLLSWRRSELERICADAAIPTAADPSNEDDRFERVRVRQAIAREDWLDAGALARSASHLAVADASIEWAVDQEWRRAVAVSAGEIRYLPTDSPDEFVRRLVERCVSRLATEGDPDSLRGAELDRLLETLRSGGTATIRGVRCGGGDAWTFVPAPKRTRRNRDGC
jgi:tRNA(Ile)-lysidine synthase